MRRVNQYRRSSPLARPARRARTPQQIANDIEAGTDEHGTPVVRVKTASGRAVFLDAEDFQRLLNDGWTSALSLASPGRTSVFVMTRKRRSASRADAKGCDAIVARLVTGAGPDEAVRYLNGRYDLRKRSLAVVKSPQGAAMRASRAAKAIERKRLAREE